MKKLFSLILLTTIAVGCISGGVITVVAQSPEEVTQGSISGDNLCGANADSVCDVSHFTELIRKVVVFIIALTIPLMVAIIVVRFTLAYFSAAQGNTSAYKEATKKAGQSILGLMIVVAVFSGIVWILLEFLGASPTVTKLLKLVEASLVPTAFAQESEYLPSPISATNLYDFLLSIVALVIKFFVYPGLIAMWVWTGFALVLAQGKPDALTKAKKLIMWATISTLVVVMIQGFLIAAKGTVEQIVPQGEGGTGASVVTPTSGTQGASCYENGQSGTREADGVCYTSSGGRSDATTFCNGKPAGTLCTITGTNGSYQTGICKRDTVTGCFKANPGDACISPSGQAGSIDGNGNCQ